MAFLPAFVLIILAPWLAARFGKAESAIVAMLTGSATLLLAFFLRIENPWVWIVFYGVAMFCINIFNFLVWAFITDVIDYQEVRTGHRDDATVYAVYSWARKLGQALAGGLIGVALGWIGYNSTAAAAGTVQAQEAIEGIYTLTHLVPGVGAAVVALCLIFLYPLKKKTVEANVAVLESRRTD